MLKHLATLVSIAVLPLACTAEDEGFGPGGGAGGKADETVVGEVSDGDFGTC